MGSIANKGRETLASAPGGNVGPRTLGIVLPLFAISLAVYTVRIWTRARPKLRLNAADYTISVAMAAETISIIFTIIAVSNGFGRPTASLTAYELEVIGVTTYAVFAVAYFASCFGRISVACLLLQFTQPRAWRAVLWAMIVFQGLLLLACEFVVFLQCRPIRSFWAHSPDAKCFTPKENWTMGYLFAGVGTFSDILFAALPMLLIWRLSRSVVERLLVSILLGLGLLGVVANAVKIVTLQTFRIGSANVVADMMPVYLWSRIEEIVIIIAACAPLLKAPIEGLLNRWIGLRLYPPVGSLNTVHTLPSDVVNDSKHSRWYNWYQRSSSTEASNSTIP